MEKSTIKREKAKLKVGKTNAKGITLIALVITIIIIIILAVVAINAIFGESGLITRAEQAAFLSNVASLEEEINLYKMGEQVNGKEGIEQYPVTTDTLESVDKDTINSYLKTTMVQWATTAEEGEIASIDTIDYSKFYKIDKEKVPTANSFNGDLYLIDLGNDYRVISLEGEEYGRETIYILIPLNNIPDPEYIAVGNNTYKLYGDGRLKVVGELTANSGITDEEQSNLSGIHELDLNKIAEGTSMAINSNVETEDEIAKAYGVKRIYISCGTAFVIDANDDLWAWGDNSYNKLGQGNSYIISTPVKILEGRTEGAIGVKAKNVWGGATNTYVLDTNNQLWSAGTNTRGELGQGNTNSYSNFVPVYVDGLDLNTTNIEKIEISTGTQTSNIFILCNNGKTYGCGSNSYGQLGIGNTANQTRFIDLTQYDEKWGNVKDLYIAGIYSMVLTNDNILYGTGYNAGGALGGINNNQNTSSLIQIKDNIEEFVESDLGRIAKSTDGTIFVIGGSRIREITDGIGKNVKLLNYGLIWIDGNLYTINSNATSLILYSDQYEVETVRREGRYIQQFVSNNKIYVVDEPDITNPNSKGTYTLREVFNNAIYVGGKVSNLSIVDENGNIYENLTTQNTEVTNVRKLVTSSGARYALTNTGELYAKGNQYTGMWGSVTARNNYVQVTMDGTTPFDNVKDIYTVNTIRTSYGAGAIFMTEDNKIYWAGSASYSVALPNLQGDIQATEMGRITSYPKEVTSGTIYEIRDKISDIKMNYINSGGIQGKNGLILTEDGKVYTYSYGNSRINMSGLNKELSDYEEIIIKEGVPAKEIETQDGLSLVLLSNGEVYGWGYNTYGILGDGYEIGGIYLTPVKLNIENVRTMTLGDNFAIFETNAGEVYGIGTNDYGQLGTGDNKGASTFVRCVELEK